MSLALTYVFSLTVGFGCDLISQWWLRANVIHLRICHGVLKHYIKAKKLSRTAVFFLNAHICH